MASSDEDTMPSTVAEGEQEGDEGDVDVDVDKEAVSETMAKRAKVEGQQDKQRKKKKKRKSKGAETSSDGDAEGVDESAAMEQVEPERVSLRGADNPAIAILQAELSKFDPTKLHTQAATAMEQPGMAAKPTPTTVDIESDDVEEEESDTDQQQQGQEEQEHEKDDVEDVEDLEGEDEEREGGVEVSDGSIRLPSSKTVAFEDSTGSLARDQLLDTQRRKGRKQTVTIALPGSIIDNAQSPELRSYLAGQIARAAAVFEIDEIVIFHEDIKKHGETQGVPQSKKGQAKRRGQQQSLKDADEFLEMNLKYLECPQYLRKYFFPLHKHLKYAGLLNPVDAPHHMRADAESRFREGVTLSKPVKRGKGSYVDVGLRKECQIDKHVQPNVRVTVEIDLDQYTAKGKTIRAHVVSPAAPRQEHGLYWGYTVRRARSLAHVFSECPHKEGYDLKIGTSERGSPVGAFKAPKKFQHCLVVFGGVEGLEATVDAEEAMTTSAADLFDAYLNTCPTQGSRTIRTEEAILISMAAIQPKLNLN
eukprot:m.15174 g.15174  ORF g.15174 m.15174 type:complete len:533 (-) comp6534_c0_seq1:177-1775(-)